MQLRAVIVTGGMVAALSMAGCNDDSNPTAVPVSVDPTGEWSTTYAIVRDDCGLCPDCESPILEDLFITKVDEALLNLEWEEDATCEPYPVDVTFDSSRSAYVFADRFQFSFLDEMGCQIGYRSNAEVVFGESTLSGFINESYEIISGVGECEFPAFCEFKTTLDGTRCEGCWDGCTPVASAAGALVRPYPGAGRRPFSRFAR